jgi:hypothetical protein
MQRLTWYAVGCDGACVLNLRPPSKSDPSDALPTENHTVDVGCSSTEAARGGTQTFLPQRALHSTSCGRSNITVVLLAVCVGMAWQPIPSCDAVRSGKPPSLPPVLSRTRARVSERAARWVPPVDTLSMPRVRSTDSAAAYMTQMDPDKNWFGVECETPTGETCAPHSEQKIRPGWAQLDAVESYRRAYTTYPLFVHCRLV